MVQGRVTWRNETLDDLILLRSDGTPTYMLAVVVDDHDMGVTHVIRGDDHLTNAARQTLIYRAMDWDLPVFAHIPLIHGPDGAKLSKRHGALGVDAYRDMGFLSPRRCATTWRGSAGATATTSSSPPRRRSPGSTSAISARRRPDSTSASWRRSSGQHIRAADDAALLAEVEGFLALQKRPALTATQRARMLRGMPGPQGTREDHPANP